jgi:hypothetical protein
MSLKDLVRLYHKPLAKDKKGVKIEGSDELYSTPDFKGKPYTAPDGMTIKSAGGEYYVITKKSVDMEKHAVEAEAVKTRAGQIRIPKAMTAFGRVVKSLLSTTDKVAVKWSEAWAEQVKSDLWQSTQAICDAIDRNVAGKDEDKAATNGYTLNE